MKYPTLEALASARLQSFPTERVAFVFNDDRVCWGTVREKVDAFAGALLALGVKPGTGVGWTLPNCPELFYLILAASRLGAWALPLFHMIPDAVKVGIYAQSRVAFVLTSAAQVPGLEAAAQRQNVPLKVLSLESLDLSGTVVTKAGFIPVGPPMPLLMASSSGTTGIPKPVLMTQQNVGAVMEVAEAMSTVGPLSGDTGFRSAMAFPLSTSGVLVALGMMLAGVEQIFSADMSPMTFLSLASKHQAHALSAPPAYFEAILAIPRLPGLDLSAVRCVMTGMDFFAPSLLGRLRERFPGICCAANGYGLVETSTIFMLWKANNEEELSEPTTRMSLIPGVGNAFDIRDAQGTSLAPGVEGEVWLTGPSVVRGYLAGGDDAKAAFVEGWFRTGDVAIRLDETSLNLLGRRKYLIKRGGKSVSPVVVRQCIEQMPGVRTAVVVGVPNPLYGEMIWAFVVPTAEVTVKDVMKQCRANLANYMVPDQVTFIDTIPRHPGVGKENLDALVERARAELEALEGGAR